MRKTWLAAALGVLLTVPAAGWADTLIMRNGSQHEGQFVSGTSRVITFREDGRMVRYDVDDVDSVQFGTTPPPSGTSSNSGYSNPDRSVYARPDDHTRYDDADARADRNSDTRGDRSGDVIPSGTELVIRTNEDIDSRTARPDQVFLAQVDQDILGPSGNVLVPRGSDARLVIRQIKTGSTTGSPELTLDVESMTVDGHRYMIDTSDLAAKGNTGIGKNKRTGEMVGGGAVLGTIIGAIAGGGKGAAIGAIAGGAAGAGAQIITKGKDVRVPAETTLRFRLDQPVHLRDVR